MTLFEKLNIVSETQDLYQQAWGYILEEITNIYGKKEEYNDHEIMASIDSLLSDIYEYQISGDDYDDEPLIDGDFDTVTILYLLSEASAFQPSEK